MPPAGDPSGPSLVRSQQQGGAFAGVSAPSHQASLSSSLTQKSIDVVELENKKLKQKLDKVGERRLPEIRVVFCHSTPPFLMPILKCVKRERRRERESNSMQRHRGEGAGGKPGISDVGRMGDEGTATKTAASLDLRVFLQVRWGHGRAILPRKSCPFSQPISLARAVRHNQVANLVSGKDPVLNLQDPPANLHCPLSASLRRSTGS